ncbi:YkgJ family cysteine cluster protein [Dyadobacter sp. CY356]|uniref:YkgJ family cysteine cluster protein n=1 Tax=Dyadobacter sp. CY356 TaxID=2906442 RepID=UPI001F20F0FA|nr:YkgJ family cysteine cluster protein [Dyadobacter sp. CY356]MCF0054620.1 YkgJ family cysteine cluster protein [Dyadobacter sp. CY356]
MSDSKNEISDLCVGCGMCCDGTLFNKAVVWSEDERKMADDLGLFTFEIKEKLFFKLPCSQFSSCCNIYEQRPSTCSVFFCHPIKRYQLGEQTFMEVEQQILLLREHRDKLLKVASNFPELSHLNFRDLKNMLEESADDDEKIGTYRMLFLVFFIFDDIETKYFKRGKEVL